MFLNVSGAAALARWSAPQMDVLLALFRSHPHVLINLSEGLRSGKIIMADICLGEDSDELTIPSVVWCMRH